MEWSVSACGQWIGKLRRRRYQIQERTCGMTRTLFQKERERGTDREAQRSASNEDSKTKEEKKKEQERRKNGQRSEKDRSSRRYMKNSLKRAGNDAPDILRRFFKAPRMTMTPQWSGLLETEQ